MVEEIRFVIEPINKEEVGGGGIYRFPTGVEVDAIDFCSGKNYRIYRSCCYVVDKARYVADVNIHLKIIHILLSEDRGEDQIPTVIKKDGGVICLEEVSHASWLDNCYIEYRADGTLIYAKHPDKKNKKPPDEHLVVFVSPREQGLENVDYMMFSIYSGSIAIPLKSVEFEGQHQQNKKKCQPNKGMPYPAAFVLKRDSIPITEPGLKDITFLTRMHGRKIHSAYPCFCPEENMKKNYLNCLSGDTKRKIIERSYVNQVLAFVFPTSSQYDHLHSFAIISPGEKYMEVVIQSGKHGDCDDEFLPCMDGTLTISDGLLTAEPFEAGSFDRFRASCSSMGWPAYIYSFVFKREKIWQKQESMPSGAIKADIVFTDKNKYGEAVLSSLFKTLSIKDQLEYLSMVLEYDRERVKQRLSSDMIYRSKTFKVPNVQGNNCLIIHFNREREKVYKNLIQDCIERRVGMGAVKLEPLFVSQLQDLELSEKPGMALVLVDKNIDDKILDEYNPRSGVDFSRMAVTLLIKMEIDFFVVYLGDEGSKDLNPGLLYNPQLNSSIVEECLLKEREKADRVITSYKELTDSQRNKITDLMESVCITKKKEPKEEP